MPIICGAGTPRSAYVLGENLEDLHGGRVKKFRLAARPPVENDGGYSQAIEPSAAAASR